MVNAAEVKKHNNKDDCWVIVHGKVYDVTEFLPSHPGGQKVILKFAGKDATKRFEPIHPPDTLDKYLPKDKHIGILEAAPASAKTNAPKKKQPAEQKKAKSLPPPPPPPADDDDEEEEEDEDEIRRQQFEANKPPLSQMYNLLDFEHIASKVMSKTGWAYYSSGADDEISLRENHRAFHRIWFKPRILVDVKNVDFSTTMLGTKTAMPFYVTATALGKLGHPEGETVLTRAAAKHDIIQMIPTLASCSFDEIVNAADGKQTQWLQLYVNSDKSITKSIIEHAEKRGIKGLFITVDAPQLGRREKDMRSKYEEDAADVQDESGEIDRSQGAARAISSFIDPSLSWKDIPWFQSVTKMPIILKGVQRGEDAVLAAEHGVQGIVISNHGGRQLEFARSSIEVLVEVQQALKAKGLQGKLEIYIDGGIRRATDIIKAVCLGATGVGIGRPFLYAMSSYGEAGVSRAFQLLKDEFEMNMRLLGANTIADLNESLLDIRSLDSHHAVPNDVLSDRVYEPMISPAFKGKL